MAKLFQHRIYLDEFIGSFLIAMLVMSQNFLGISEILFGTTLPFKILLVLGSIIAFLYYEKEFSIKQFGVFFFVFIFAGITFVSYTDTSSVAELLEAFLIYGCSAFIFSFCRFNEVCLFRMCIFFGFLWLGLFLLDSKMNIGSTFLFGYKILPLVLASILLLTYRTNSIPQIIIRIIFLLVSSFFLIRSGSRGPVLCVIIFLFIHFLPALKKLKTAIIYLSVLVLFIALFINLTAIVTAIYNAFPNKFEFIDKTYSLIASSSGVDNGRSQIIERIFQEYTFKDFIFGIGVGGYSAAHPVEDYTHNIFLSVALDFGIIGVLLIVYLIVVFVFRVMLNDKNHRYLEFLFTLSFVTLFFSMNYWKMFSFWLLVFYMLWYCISIRDSIDSIDFKRRELACS